MNRTDAAAEQNMADGVEETILLRGLDPSERLPLLAALAGDISPLLTEQQLSTIGADCVSDYEQDLTDREEWEKTVKKAFKAAAQEPNGEKTFPWKGASNVNYPLLTSAAMQFHARAYPAIVRGDEAVICKVVGQDRGQPQIDSQTGQPAMQLVPGPDGQAMPQPLWRVPPGAKSARAKRVAEYMNSVIFYRMKRWDADTDALLQQLPIAGCAFRKVWVQDGEQRSALVPALRLVAPMAAKDCESAPRLTEIREDETTNDIIGRQRSGFYRTVTIEDVERAEDGKVGRVILEQHCLIDLDEDGYDEPYVVTIDHCTSTVLRIEPDYAPEDLTMNEVGEVVSIKRRCYYIKYDFLPDLEGRFYGMGLGHLLEQIGEKVNQALNQIMDAGAAQVAGGGFIASGVNLQGAGRRPSNVYFTPGEYKTVSVNAADLRAGIYERTFPGPSPIMFQTLDLLLGAARDISSVKDILTGEGSNNGQVGTTLALIEQGLQVFTAIYKRIYRSLKEEFELLRTNIAKYGGQKAAEDYATLLDDMQADFEADFNMADFDIRPVSDPTSVTRMQRMAKAQFLMQFIAAPGINPQAVYKRVFEAASIEDADELLVPPQPPMPNPKDIAQAQKYEADATLTMEKAATEAEERDHRRLEVLASQFAMGHQIGMAQ